jgi:general secretion pathway protein C
MTFKLPTNVLPRATQTAVFVFVVLAAWNAARLTWTAVLPHTEAAASAAPAQAPVQNHKAMPDVQRIISAQLFGAPQRQTGGGGAPETHLALTLKGTYALGGGQGYAIIAQAGSHSKVYGTGDKLPDGVQVAEVYDDRVILNTGQGKETLKLTKFKGGGILLTQVSSGNSLQRQIAHVRQELLRNPFQFRDYVNALPVSNDGHFKGYRLTPGRKPTLFNELGLRPGDIVTAINGVSLDNPGRAMGLIEQLHNAPSVSLTVDRNGQQLTLNKSLR